MLFQLDDRTTGDGFAIELDAATDRLFVRSRIDDRGERVMVLVDARRVARELADALVLAISAVPTATAPKKRAAKLPQHAGVTR